MEAIFVAMISIRQLTATEIENANRESRASYWSFPIAFSIATLVVTAVLHWRGVRDFLDKQVGEKKYPSIKHF